MATPESPYGPSTAENVAGSKPVRLPRLLAAKAEGTRLTMITAYDGLTAAIFDQAGMDMILVGDSIGNVMLGHGSTLPVSLDEMVVATRGVASAVERAFVIADLPFGTYEASPEQALASAVRLVKAGANAVKLEGGRPRVDAIRTLTDAGIPVMGHLGFTPQSVNALGGFRVQGRGEEGEKLLADALAIEEAGVMGMVLEMVPEPVAARVTEALAVPTIGIGAGAHCDGQVLVWSDMAGMTEWRPRFAKQFGRVGDALRQAALEYAAAVREGSFPAPEQTFDG